jgi:serine/threonine protein kinase
MSCSRFLACESSHVHADHTNCTKYFYAMRRSIHSYIHTCTHTYRSRIKIVHADHVYINMYIHTYTYTHTYIHTYMHIHTYTYIINTDHTHTYIHTYRNIMLDSMGTPKYIDFGLSKERESDASFSQTGSTVLSRHKQEWASPEKRANKASTQVSDVYSLGLVMIYVLTEKKPATTPYTRRKDVQQLQLPIRVAELILRSTEELPRGRPTAFAVMFCLEMEFDLDEMPLGWTQPMVISSSVA